MEELLNDAGHRAEQQLKLSEQTFEFASTVQERFAKGDPKTKKEILATIGSNLILKDKKLLIEAKKPFFILENTLSPENPKMQSIEPEITETVQGQKIPSLFLRPCLLGDLDDVRTSMRKAQRAAALTLFHELTHATGHTSRLSRAGITEPIHFGRDPYSREELVAEMGAAFLCGHCGIENRTIQESAAYIQGWLDRLRDDRKLIVHAATQAQKACDFIRSTEQPPDERGAN